MKLQPVCHSHELHLMYQQDRLCIFVSLRGDVSLNRSFRDFGLLLSEA
jgi:hypothetical protein